MSDKFKKLSFKEIQEIAERIKYWDDIPVGEICDTVKRLFGEKAVKATIHIADEYNDNTYDLKATHMSVFDKEGKEIELESLGDKKVDKFYDFLYSLEFGGSSYDGERDLGNFNIDIVNEIITDNKGQMPELYIKE